MVLLLLGEGVARYSIRYNPSYYTAVSATNAIIEYPYGIIKRNSLGHPDDEFDMADPRPGIAYVGDSVTMGLAPGMATAFQTYWRNDFHNFSI